MISIKPLLWLRGYKYIKAFNQLYEIRADYPQLTD